MDFLKLLMELVVDVLVPSFIASAAELIRERRGGLDPETGATGQVASGTMVVIIGSLAGFASSLIFPHPIMGQGAGLLVAPLGAGLAMHLFGAWRDRRGSYSSSLATFWGGALFGLAAAIVRFLVIRYR
ncbi:MAG: hypothetical protein ABSH50_06940 [Bryobacteraceae bacterium]